MLSEIVKYIGDKINDIKTFKRPMFIDMHSKNYDCISKCIYYDVKNKLNELGNKPCILGRYYKEYLTSYFIGSKHISHVGIYTGQTINNIPEAVIHAIGSGVVVEPLVKFLSCDKFYIIQPNISEDDLQLALYKAILSIGSKYDYDFFSDKSNNKFYCSELIYHCFEKNKDELDIKMIKRKKMFFINCTVIEPEDIFMSTANYKSKLSLEYAYPKVDLDKIVIDKHF